MQSKATAEELRRDGFALLHDARTEPWGQTVARLRSVEGAIVGPHLRPRCTRDVAEAANLCGRI
jgi:hypothetical protein